MQPERVALGQKLPHHCFNFLMSFYPLAQGDIESPSSPPIIEGPVVERRPSSLSAEDGATYRHHSNIRSPADGQSRGNSTDGGVSKATSSRERQMFDQRIGGDRGELSNCRVVRLDIHLSGPGASTERESRERVLLKLLNC